MSGQAGSWAGQLHSWGRPVDGLTVPVTGWAGKQGGWQRARTVPRYLGSWIADTSSSMLTSNEAAKLPATSCLPAIHLCTGQLPQNSWIGGRQKTTAVRLSSSRISSCRDTTKPSITSRNNTSPIPQRLAVLTVVRHLLRTSRLPETVCFRNSLCFATSDCL